MLLYTVVLICVHINSIVYTYSYNGGTRTITLSNLDIDTTLMALDSLTYTYSSNVFPESFSGATRLVGPY